jgi:hypothetical protein
MPAARQAARTSIRIADGAKRPVLGACAVGRYRDVDEAMPTRCHVEFQMLNAHLRYCGRQY